ncbi:tryptophanyl-tRNA synthetase [Hypoxylon sp. NC1633]|nr:tryptophanyl-tRNA synthetase [Hypoxylon sp. NC1633]
MRSTLRARCRPVAGPTRRQIQRSPAALRVQWQQVRNKSTIDLSGIISGADARIDGPGGEVKATETKKPKRNVVFSGIQPTGVPHLGNYLGALRQWKQLQDDVHSSGSGDKLLFSVVDLHAITMPQDAAVLRLHRREMLAALLAIGLDPKKGSTLFFQSSVPQHTELMWILSCTASMGYLGRMTQWKSKLQEDNKAAAITDATMAKLKLGLFSYPVLQAADILVHRATHVPVGEDQRQHLEFARECATNFNHAFKDILISPETITTPSPRIMSLTHPPRKMSKSDPNHRSRIQITSPPAEIRQRINSAVTDSLNTVTWDPEHRPGVANLLELLSQCSPPRKPEAENESGNESWPTPEQLAEQYAAAGAALRDLKADVADAVCRELDGVHERYDDFLHRKGGKWLDEIEAEGAEAARANAEETMRLVRHAVGLGPRPR